MESVLSALLGVGRSTERRPGTQEGQLEVHKKPMCGGGLPLAAPWVAAVLFRCWVTMTIRKKYSCFLRLYDGTVVL